MAQFEFVLWLVKWIDSQKEFHFDWNEGNIQKNQNKHDVTSAEAEALFSNTDFLFPLGIQIEPKAAEPRFGALGMTLLGRHLSVCFTIREGQIRIISIRPMSKKERKHYEEIRKK